MTHPFPPWLGREFVSVGVRRTWGEDRVFFFDADGVQRSLPTGWTDAGDPDPFVLVAGGRCPFRVEDLLVLVEVLRRAVAMTVGKADFADYVGRFCRTCCYRRGSGQICPQGRFSPLRWLQRARIVLRRAACRSVLS